ncbi:MAG: hypothetical protein QOD58_2034 [Mycobacterium sp.]|nr:hypothetical protein [Mycobacterium sp.]
MARDRVGAHRHPDDPAAINAKYAAFRPTLTGLPTATQAYYAETVFLRFVPEGKILTWDNERFSEARPKPTG